MVNDKNPTQPLRCFVCGPSNVGKSDFLTNLNLNINNEYDKTYNYSPSLHQDLNQKFIKCFSNFMPIHIVPNILNEGDFDIIIEELVNTVDFEKSDTTIEIYESIEELKFPENYDDGGNIILDELNKKETNDSRVQAMFKRS